MPRSILKNLFSCLSSLVSFGLVSQQSVATCVRILRPLVQNSAHEASIDGANAVKGRPSVWPPDRHSESSNPVARFHRSYVFIPTPSSFAILAGHRPGIALRFLDELRLELHRTNTVNLAVDVVITIHQPDVLHFGAALDHQG